MVTVRRALVSVSDKRELDTLAAALARHGVEVLSTGGTARALRDAGARVVEVADYTGAPEILDGRVKTLHPRIHGGLLGRPTSEHRAEMERHHIEPIDLVVVNLYPFSATVARPGVHFGEAVENIDIGGPSMIRSAAKNHERVAVVVDPLDYPAIIAELDGNAGALSAATRFRLARKAFAHTAAYDGAIANFLTALPDEPPGHDAVAAPAAFPSTLTLQVTGGTPLRYGENPHQQAAFYRDLSPPARPSVAFSQVLGGKELSFNNLVDLEAALETVLEFSTPAAVIIKHSNPCGVATAPSCLLAYERARACDPVSAFGGVVALNRAVDAKVGEKLAETFLECVIAPGFDEAARAALEKKKSLRLLAWDGSAAQVAPPLSGLTVKSLRGGLLVQTRDDQTMAAAQAKVVTRRAPSAEELAALDFAWRVAKHVKSNAIVFCRGTVTVGVGAGQMSRVDSVRIAVEKAQSPIAGTVVASDAFFPFRDGLDAAAAAGATAVIQPGGSVRDAEVIAAADEHGMAMLFTAMRHFWH
jgi:phosphoribosylaminoimidazolecarboxamide formyltransferase/IMP cyclohydrolase